MQTHGNLIKIFRQARPSFSITREQMFVNTQDGVTREFMKGATRGLREEWMEENLKEIILS